MVDKLFDKIMLLVEKSAYIQVVFFAVGSAVLYLPSDVLSKMYLSHDNLSNKMLFGIALVTWFCGIALLISLIRKLVNFISKRIVENKEINQWISDLQQITQDEKIVLLAFIKFNLPFIPAREDCAIVFSLVRRNYLEMNYRGIVSEYSITESMRRFLNKNCESIFGDLVNLSLEELDSRLKAILGVS